LKNASWAKVDLAGYGRPGCRGKPFFKVFGFGPSCPNSFSRNVYDPFEYQVKLWVCLYGCSAHFLLLYVREIGIELIEAAIPEGTLFFEPSFRDSQWLRRKPVGPDTSRLSRFDQSTIFENIEMLEK
jgi:hypothetical protein